MKKLVKKDKSVNKKVRNATRIEINGIKFRSKLEAFAYEKLIAAGITNFEYEKNKFVLQDKFVYNQICIEEGEEVTNNIRELTYTPDFVCIDNNKNGWIIEIKGFSNDVWPIKWKLFKRYLCDRGYTICLYKPNSQKNVLKCIEDIKNKYYENK